MMNNIITMRKLLTSKSDAKVLRKLKQLNIGVHYGSNAILGSKWTIGCHEPTLEWVRNVRKNIANIDETCKRFGFEKSWLDKRLKLELDWTRHFGVGPTGGIILDPWGDD